MGLRARLVWSLGIADTIGFTQLQLYQLQQTTRRSISRVGVRGIGAAGIYEQLLFGARCEIATSHFCHSVIFPIVTLLLVKVYGVCHSHRKNRKLTTMDQDGHVQSCPGNFVGTCLGFDRQFSQNTTYNFHCHRHYHFRDHDHHDGLADNHSVFNDLQ